MDNNKQFTDEKGEAEDIKKILLRYLRYWPLFLFTVAIAVSLAFIYLRYTPAVYQTAAKIQVLKEQGGIDMSGFQGASPLIDLSKVNLENETEIIKSRRLAEKVVTNLGLETTVKLLGNIRTSELWNDETPFDIFWEGKETHLISLPEILIETINKESFKLAINGLNIKGTFNYGDLIDLESIGLRIILKPSVLEKKNIEFKNYAVYKSSVERAVTRLSSSINIENIGQRSEVLKVLMIAENKKKSEDIINTLLEQFNSDGVDDNRKIAKQTEDFAIKRLEFLYKELDTVEGSLVSFKSKNDLVSVETSVAEFYAKSSESERRLLDAEQQLMLVEEFKKDMDEQSAFNLLPANIGIADRGVNEFTVQYNDLVLERNKLLVSSTLESGIIQQLNQQIIQVKQTIIRSLENYKRTLEITIREVQKQDRFFKGRLSSLPKQEKEIREIARQQLVKESLFLFLLQKREEAALSSAVTSDIAKVVDYAYTIPIPVSPKTQIIYLGALLIGLILPFGGLYIFFLLDTKINSKEDVIATVGNINIVGEIPILDKGLNEVVRKEDNHPVAESFRILRTNLNYIGLKQSKTEHDPKVIFVTSTVKGEGKTFTAINLASTIVSTNKKVILIGADLRNPQIHNYLGLSKNREGLSRFLYDKNCMTNEVIETSARNLYGFDVVLSGQIPPNPTELLLNGRFEILMEELKKIYDYIIVDTAPTILVTDSMLISEEADATLYLIRVGHTDTQLLEHLSEIKAKNKLQNIGVVINGLKNTGAYAYNYGYGYGYQENTKGKRNRLKFWSN